MSRQPTPANILADVLTADVATPDRTALRNRLRWDYSQVAPVDPRPWRTPPSTSSPTASACSRASSPSASA